MANKFTDLAAQFNAALVQAEEQQKQAQAEAEKAAQQLAELKEAAVAARKELLNDLQGFGKGMPVLSTRRSKKGGLTFGFKDKVLSFTPDGDADRVRISYDGSPEDEHLFRAQDGDEVVWVLSRSEIVAPLMTQGFFDLLVVGLGLPAPGEYIPLAEMAAEPEPEPEPEPELELELEADTDHAQTSFPEYDDSPPLDTEERRDVREVLEARRNQGRVNRAARTRVEGNTSEPWSYRPTNPGPKKKKPRKEDVHRLSAGESTSDYDIRPTHTQDDNPRRKRKFKPDSGVGSAVKPYKPIIS